MMLKQTLLITLLIISRLHYGQLWIDPVFSYDSSFNIHYNTATNFIGQSENLHLNLYTPRCSTNTNTGPRPLLIWVHGGGFIAGSKDDAGIVQTCRQFASRGYVVASVNYRLGYVNDAAANSCNFPNYACLFAADSSEWVRAWYRGVQDVAAALQFLVRNKDSFQIDPTHIFIGGESAGAFISLGVALLDTAIEKPMHAGALASVSAPHSSSSTCPHAQGKTFPSSIPRPDLGPVWTQDALPFEIKGVANVFGGLYFDLMQHHQQNRPKPAIYSFHQPCDIVVPIDSNRVYWGLSWCLTNGYGCNAIRNNEKMVMGARSFTQLNQNKNYGYTLKNDFTSKNFPFQFLIGSGSCTDQINTPCHDYDNKQRRMDSIAYFFAQKNTLKDPCTPTSSVSTISNNKQIKLYPNPFESSFRIVAPSLPPSKYTLLVKNNLGQIIRQYDMQHLAECELDGTELNTGFFTIEIYHYVQLIAVKKIIKN
jgi:acetyl esterase/lipase